MKDRTKVLAGGFEEPGEPGSSEPKAKGSCSRRYGLEERKRLLADLAASGEWMAACRARHLIDAPMSCASTWHQIHLTPLLRPAGQARR